MSKANTDGRKKTGKILIELSVAVVIITAVIGFGYYQSIINNWRVISEKDLFLQAFIKTGNWFQLKALNQESLYIFTLSVFFSFLGNKEELVFVINLILQILGMGFFCLGAKKLYSSANPLIAFGISGVLSIGFYSSIKDSSMHEIWFLTGFIFWICSIFYKNIKQNNVKYILIGALLGVCTYVDLAGAFVLVFFVILALLNKEVGIRDKSLQMLALLLCVFNGYMVMFYLWNNFIFDVASLQQWYYDRTVCMITTDGMCQYISIAILLMISVIFYIPKHQEDMVTVDDKHGVILEISNSVADTTVDVQDNVDMPKPIKFIENPLPLPKKHVKKEMTYAFEPTEEQMHYDYNNYRLDDDYDLKDI